MKILGIVAEYDPFHKGHLYHLTEARKLVQPDFTLVAMSGWVKQRGNLPLLSPESRTRCALESGADAVFALPALWTCRDAEHYARGAVHLLSKLGITHLAFGAENPDLSVLEQTSLLLEDPALQQRIAELVHLGTGYPAALAKAAGLFFPQAGEILQKPNNTLAICYLRAIRHFKLSITPICIPRCGAYHDLHVDEVSPSASAIRSSIQRGDWARADAALPEITSLMVHRAALAHQLPQEGITDALLIHRLRSMTQTEASDLPDVSEGLENRILKAAQEVFTAGDLISRVSCKRYPAARISRICTWALLGGTRNLVEQATLPEEALLLGMKKNPGLTRLWKNSGFPILPTLAHRQQDPFWAPDLAAARLFALCTNRTGDYPFTEKLLTITSYHSQ